MIVQKFGGTSVGTLENVRRVADIVANGGVRDTVVVLSAVGGVTNLLIRAGDEAAAERDFRSVYDEVCGRYSSLVSGLAGEYARAAQERIDELLRELREILDAARSLKFIDPRMRDLLVSFGERMMCAVFPQFLRARGVAALEVDARGLIVTDDVFGHARVLFGETGEKIRAWYGELGMVIPVVTGYIGATVGGATTTLDRGGSDYTATIIGGALGAERVEIWTDVDGAMTADPRIVPEARVLGRLSYAEAAEMAYFGAKVIHPLTLVPVRERGIPVVIRNTFHRETPGTVIDGSEVVGSAVRSVAARSGLSLLNVEGAGLQGMVGFSGRLFSALGRARVNVVMISQASSEQSMCFVVNGNDRDQALRAVCEEFARERTDGLVKVSAEDDVCILAIVGDGMAGTVGISGRFFVVLGEAGVNVRAIAQGSSERNISAVLAEADRERAVRTVHDEFVGLEGV